MDRVLDLPADLLETSPGNGSPLIATTPLQGLEDPVLPILTSSPSPNANPAPPPPPPTLVVTTPDPATTVSPNMLAMSVADQLQKHHGCKMDPHQLGAQPSPHGVSLSTMTGWACLDCLKPLENQAVTQHGTPWDEWLPPPMRRQLFTGLSEALGAERPHIDLKVDCLVENDDEGLQIAWDIDSVGGLASSLYPSS